MAVAIVEFLSSPNIPIFNCLKLGFAVARVKVGIAFYAMHLPS